MVQKTIRRSLKVRRTPVPRRQQAEAPRSFMGMLAMLTDAGQRLQRSRPRRVHA